MTDTEYGRVLTGRARLVIATQTQPVEIVRLSREDRALGLSVMCVNGTEEQTRVSRDYNRFVGRPAGLIERLYGHDSFRMDVDPDIGSGSSWQLGVLLAHALENKQRLLCRLDEPDGTEDILVWATGAVRVVDMAVQPVGHVADKLTVSMEMFRQARDAGIQCLVFLPAANMDEVSQEQRDQLAAMQIELHGLEDARQAFKLLQLQVPMLRERGVEGGQGGKVLPYPGLRAYSPGERGMFFGRNRARADALERLRRNAAQGCGLLVIHGRSGAGKSSFVLAGLAGDVAEQAHEGGQWHIAVARFGEAGETAGQSVIRALGESLELSNDAVESFVAEMSADPDGAFETYLKQSVARDGKRSLLLVLDQFEQVFSGESAPETLEALDVLIDRLVRSGRVWVVLTMRTDQLERLERLPHLSRQLDDTHLFWLQAPDLSELNEIIGRPAQLAGYRFETGTDGVALLDTLAEKAMQSPGSLPLLQIVLSRLVDFAGAEKVLGFAALERIGGFEGAIAQWAEQAIAQLKQREISDSQIARVLAALVRPAAEGEQFLSRPIRTEDGGDGEDRRGEIIAHLVAARLLTTEAAPEGASARLAHESLIRNWPRLARLVADVRQGLILRERLETMADEYRQSGEDPRLLFRDEVRLSLAQELIAQDVVELDGATRFYVERSSAVMRAEKMERLEAEARHRQVTEDRARLAQRLFRRTAIGVGVAAVLAVLAGGAAFTAFGQFERAGSREGAALALLAQTRVETDPVDAVKLGLAAMKMDGHGVVEPIFDVVYVRAREMLRTDVVLEHAGVYPSELLFSWSGDRILSWQGNRAAVNDTHSGKSLGVIELPTHIADAGFNSANQVILLTDDGMIHLWDGGGGEDARTEAMALQPVDALNAVDAMSSRFSISRDGGRILGSNSSSGQTFLWDSGNGRVLSSLTAAFSIQYGLSPDGRYSVYSVPEQVNRLVVHDWESGHSSSVIDIAGDDPLHDRRPVFVNSTILAVPSGDRPNGFELFGVDGEHQGSIAIDVPEIWRDRLEDTWISDIAFNDRLYAATMSNDSDVRVMIGPLDGSKAYGAITVSGRGTRFAISPDGRLTALNDDYEIRIVHNHPYVANDVTAVELAHAQGIEAVSGDGGLALVQVDAHILLRDTGTGAELAALSSPEGTLTDSYFAPDGTSATVLFADYEAKSIAIYRFAQSEASWTVDLVLARKFDTPSPLLRARLASNGNLVLMAREENASISLSVLEIPDGRTILLGDIHSSIIPIEVRIGEADSGAHRDDETIGNSDIFDVINYQPEFGIELPTVIKKPLGEITHARLIADGQFLLAYGSGSLWGIDMETGEILGRYLARSGIRSISPSADEKHILVVEDNGAVWSWAPDFLNFDKYDRICRYLPLVNGERDLDLTNLAADIGIASLPDIGPCP